jgi:CTP:molybdopterin cytidylyltransferase MocA
MGVFTQSESEAGFPFVLRRTVLRQVEEQIAAKRFSLQALAAKCRAKMSRVSDGSRILCNVNTPEDWRIVKRLKKKDET